MQEGTAEVKTTIDGNRTVAGTATYPVFDLVSEAVESLGEAKSLQLINSATRTDAMNALRAASRPGGTSNKAWYDKALAWFIANDMQVLIDCAGDESQLRAVVEAKAESLKTEGLVAVGAAEVEVEAEAEEV